MIIASYHGDFPPEQERAEVRQYVLLVHEIRGGGERLSVFPGGGEGKFDNRHYGNHKWKLSVGE